MSNGKLVTPIAAAGKSLLTVSYSWPDDLDLRKFELTYGPPHVSYSEASNKQKHRRF